VIRLRNGQVTLLILLIFQSFPPESPTTNQSPEQQSPFGDVLEPLEPKLEVTGPFGYIYPTRQEYSGLAKKQIHC
jgi:hypothetical protein